MAAITKLMIMQVSIGKVMLHKLTEQDNPETDTPMTELIRDYVFNKTTYPNEQTGTTQTITGADAEAGADNSNTDLGSISCLNN